MQSSYGGNITADLVVPVYNEEKQLANSVTTLLSLTADRAANFRIIIADNASTDMTETIGRRLAADNSRVSYVRMEEKGRGRALKRVWLGSNADVLMYTDVDLATDSRVLEPMVVAVASGHADLAIASRLRHDSVVERGVKREIISRCYNALLRGGLGVRYSDAQCGCKAISRRAFQVLAPHIHDTNWFFDTELLTVAAWSGLRIQEFPADWTDDPDSSVDVVATAFEDLRGMRRIRRSLHRGELPLSRLSEAVGRRPAVPNTGAQIFNFVQVGIVSTVLYSALFVLFASLNNPHLANVVALAVSTLFNTWANGSFTFGVKNPAGAVERHVKGLFSAGLCWLFTTGALLAFANTPIPVLMVVVTIANLIATIIRFLLSKLWVYSRRRHA